MPAVTARDVRADLDALKALGGRHKNTYVPKADPAPAPPKGWEPGYKVATDGAMTVTSTAQTADVQHDEAAWHQMVEDLGLSVPPGWRVRLVEAKYDPVAWTRDSPSQDKAVTRPVWRYRFAVEPDTGRIHDEDVDSIIRDVMRTRRKRPAVKETQERRGLVVVYADPQAGKVASLGGTRELAERYAETLTLLEGHIKDLAKVGRAPTEAAWLDGGDCVESFENVESQKQTNDLTFTQQVRVHRRLSMEGLRFLAARFPKITAATCGSNHARGRRGKDVMAGPGDDWGLEVLSQVQDAFALNEESYGHVQFAYPPAYRDTVCVDVAGLPVGLAHGHQVNKPEMIHTWWKGQAFGNQPVTQARVLVTGHFHHLAAKEVGDGRLWVMAPTMDNGSDWYTMRSGEVSLPGMLVFSVTKDGWDDLRVLRPGGSEALRRPVDPSTMAS